MASILSSPFCFLFFVCVFLFLRLVQLEESKTPRFTWPGTQPGHGRVPDSWCSSCSSWRCQQVDAHGCPIKRDRSCTMPCQYTPPQINMEPQNHWVVEANGRNPVHSQVLWDRLRESMNLDVPGLWGIWMGGMDGHGYPFFFRDSHGIGPRYSFPAVWSPQHTWRCQAGCTSHESSTFLCIPLRSEKRSFNRGPRPLLFGSLACPQPYNYYKRTPF